MAVLECQRMFLCGSRNGYFFVRSQIRDSIVKSVSCAGASSPVNTQRRFPDCAEKKGCGIEGDGKGVATLIINDRIGQEKPDLE